MIDILTATLLDLMPDSLKRDPQVRALAEAITPELQDIARQIPETILLPRLDELAESVVDLLAWQLHVDFYDTALPIEQKRALVRKALDWHRRKGTPAAVEELIDTLFGDGRVEEWFEYGGDPYTFRVITNNRGVTQERALGFIRALNSAKNARSHLEKVVISQSETLPLHFAGITHIGEKITIRQVN